MSKSDMEKFEELEAIREFVKRVNTRAEAEMMKTGKLEGAHHRAMVAELKAMEEE